MIEEGGEGIVAAADVVLQPGMVQHDVELGPGVVEPAALDRLLGAHHPGGDVAGWITRIFSSSAPARGNRPARRRASASEERASTSSGRSRRRGPAPAPRQGGPDARRPGVAVEAAPAVFSGSTALGAAPERAGEDPAEHLEVPEVVGEAAGLSRSRPGVGAGPIDLGVAGCAVQGPVAELEGFRVPPHRDQATGEVHPDRGVAGPALQAPREVIGGLGRPAQSEAGRSGAVMPPEGAGADRQHPLVVLQRPLDDGAAVRAPGIRGDRDSGSLSATKPSRCSSSQAGVGVVARASCPEAVAARASCPGAFAARASCPRSRLTAREAVPRSLTAFEAVPRGIPTAASLAASRCLSGAKARIDRDPPTRSRISHRLLARRRASRAGPPGPGNTGRRVP